MSGKITGGLHVSPPLMGKGKDEGMQGGEKDGRQNGCEEENAIENDHQPEEDDDDGDDDEQFVLSWLVEQLDKYSGQFDPDDA